MKKLKINLKGLIYTLSGLLIAIMLFFSLQIFLPQGTKPLTLLGFKKPGADDYKASSYKDCLDKNGGIEPAIESPWKECSWLGTTFYETTDQEIFNNLLKPKPDRPDIKLPNGIVITAQTESVSNKFYKISHTYPIISGMSDSAVRNKINAAIEDFGNIKKLKNNFNESIGIDIEEGDNPFSDDMDFKVKYNNDSILTFVFNRSSFTGGAYENSYLSILHFDLKSGNKIELKDVFKENSDYLNKIKNILKIKYKF